MKQASCKARWASQKNSTFRDLRKLWTAYQAGREHVPDLGSIYEYGLAFDYVRPEHRRGFYRYQLSWGGPADEIRFYADSPQASRPDRVEYAFLDWFDGYSRKLTGRDLALALDLWTWFQDGGATETAWKEAQD